MFRPFTATAAVFVMMLSAPAAAQRYVKTNDKLHEVPDAQTLSMLRKCLNEGKRTVGIKSNGEVITTSCKGKTARGLQDRFFQIGMKQGGNNSSPKDIGYWGCSCDGSVSETVCNLSGFNDESGKTFTCYGVLKR